MSRGTELAKNTGIIALGTFLPKLAAFVTLPILTGWLTQDEYGMYDLVTVMVSLLLPALTLQIKAAAFRFLIDAREDRDEQRAIVSSIVSMIVPVALVSLAVLFFILIRTVEASVAFTICAYYFADMFSGTFRQFARGLGRNFDYSVSAVISALGKMVFALVLVWGVKAGLMGAIVALCMSSLLSALYLMLRLRIVSLVSLQCVRFDVLKRLIAYSWPIVPSELSLWVVQMSNRLIITAFMGLGANAIFAVATKIPQIISLAQGAFTLAWQENASLASEDDDSGKYYSLMLKAVYGLQAGFFGLVVAATPALFPLLIRGDYAASYTHIPILCLGIFFSSMATFLGGIYIAKMKTKSVGISTTLAALVSIVLNIALIAPLGLFAASVSSALSFFALFVFRLHDVRRFVDLALDVRYMLQVGLVLLLEVALCYQHVFALDIVNAVVAVVSFFLLNWALVKSVALKIKAMILSQDRSENGRDS